MSAPPPPAPRWVADALQPTADELSRLEARPEGLPAVAAATAPLPEETAALLRRLRRARPAPRVGWWVGAPALAVALIWVVTRPGPLPVGVPVALAPDDPLRLGEAVVMSGLGSLTVEALAPTGGTVRVAEGAVRFEVDPEAPDHLLRVYALDAEVRVTGTVFTVLVVQDRLSVQVERGSVVVQQGDLELALPAGGTWTGRAAPAERPGPETPLLAPSSPQPEGPPDQPSAPLGTHAVDETPGEGAVSVVSPPPSSLEDEARVAYARILDQVERSPGDPALIADLDAFLDAHGGSPYAADARALRLELWARGADPAEAVAAIDRFLSEDPDNPRRLNLLELAATLARDRLEDCGLALPLYRTLSREADGAAAERAKAWRGLCARALGLSDEANTAFESLNVQSLTPALQQAVQNATHP